MMTTQLKFRVLSGGSECNALSTFTCAASNRTPLGMGIICLTSSDINMTVI